MATATRPDLWPHQRTALAQMEHIVLHKPVQRVCVTSPTGGGKTRMMVELIERVRNLGLKVLLITHRKLLFEQTSGVLEDHGIEYGARASGHAPRLLEEVQIAMIQSELNALKKKKRAPHEADVVLIDEAHVVCSEGVEALAQHYVEAGAVIFWVTATPLGLGHLADLLITAGTNSELRKCGSLVVCKTYGPDEPDCRKLKVGSSGEFSERQQSKVMNRPGLIGRVWNHWKWLNPDGRPTILFAPDVAGSIYFAEQFQSRGVPSAHIDGDEVWLDGRRFESSPELRHEVLEMSREGKLPLISNRYVLREGIDAPWLFHCVMATPFGSLQSYLQSGGRLLRAYPGLDHVQLQDHGGNWWRHGSLNQDREWDLSYTAHRVQAMRAEDLREKKEPEPIVCPRCSACRLWGDTCQECGYKSHRRSRAVVQDDGTLQQVEGEIFKPRRRSRQPSQERLWEQMYWRAHKSGMTFLQAEANFARENHWTWPSRDWKLMPKNTVDWCRLVRNVKPERLT